MKSQRRRVMPSPRYESEMTVDNGTCTQIKKKDYRPTSFRQTPAQLYRDHSNPFNPASQAFHLVFRNSI